MGTARRKRLKPKPLKPPSVKRVWLDGFIDYAAGECHLAENTVAAYRRDLKRFFEWAAGRPVPDLTIQDLGDYVTWLHRKDFKPATLARHLVSLKVFFRYLQLEGVLEENRAELLGSQRLWERVPHVLSPEQIDSLLESPTERDPYWRRDRALLELLYATGCRASELSNLKLEDVHLNDGYCLCRGKGDKERLVPLGNRAVDAFREWLDKERPELAARVESAPAWALLSYRGRRLRRGTHLGASEALRGTNRCSFGCQSAHLAAQFCHPLAGGRCRLAPSPRDAGSREHCHDTNLHARRHVTAQSGSQEVPTREGESARKKVTATFCRNGPSGASHKR